MHLHTSSLHPLSLTIDGKAYNAEKLTVGDLVGIGEGLAQERRDIIDEEYKARMKNEENAKRTSELDKERVEAINAIEPFPPSAILPWLLTNASGQALVLHTALHKKHPEVSFEMIHDLTWNDDLIQTCYDLLDIKRRIVDKPKEDAKASSDPPSVPVNGDDGKPSSPTSSQDSTGEN